jgi:tetratricopeptide (TPR) repeat protein
MTRLALAVVLVLCAACAAPQPPQEPPAQARLTEAQTRGAARARAGDAGGAVQAYEEALRIAASLEDSDAIAASALNLAALYQRLGRDAEARSVLAVVIDDQRRPFSETRRLQAELRRAIVELALGEPRAAQAMAERAESRCAGRCAYGAAIRNVQAEAALALGEAEPALAYAQAALERARGGGDTVETGNALRNLGRAHLERGDALAARRFLEQALEIDRLLAEPRKILVDLGELARAAAKGGDAQAARGYGDRAAAVRAAMRQPQSVGEVETGLRRP